MKQWPAIRDVLLFVGGLGGVFHETVLATAERPTLLILFAAMMGLPAFLRQDGKEGSILPRLSQPQDPKQELPSNTEPPTTPAPEPQANEREGQ